MSDIVGALLLLIAGPLTGGSYLAAALASSSWMPESADAMDVTFDVFALTWLGIGITKVIIRIARRFQPSSTAD